jgi:hypothetical protein
LFGNSKRGGEPGPVKARDNFDRRREEMLKGSQTIALGSGPEANPGPGLYDRKSAIAGPKFSMAGKPPTDKAQ